MLAEQPRETDATTSYVRFDPLGVGAGRHAVELPLLAGVPLRRAGADGRQRRGCSSTPPTSRAARSQIEEVFRDAGFPYGLFADTAGRLRRRSAAHRRPARRRGHADRQRARREPGRRAGGPRAQEDRARARRQRSVHRPGRRRRRDGGPGGGRRAPDQQRPELHRGQALHRRRARWPTQFTDPIRRRAPRAHDGRSAGARHPGRAAGPRRPARRPAPAGGGVDQARRAAPAGRRDPQRPRRFLSAHGAGRAWTRACRPSTRRPSARSPR